MSARIAEMRETGVYKPERLLASPQGVHVRDGEGREILNLCANNYLGLADDPRVIELRQRRRCKTAVSAWRRCGSSAAPRTSTAS